MKFIFFGTDETATINKSDLCHYYDNKVRYSVESVANKYKSANIKKGRWKVKNHGRQGSG